MDKIDWISIIPDYIKAVSLIIAGVWAYYTFIFQRRKEPATNIDIDLTFVGQQDSKWIIEVNCILENKSLVRHTYHDLEIVVRYLLKDDQVIEGDSKINYQLKFPRTTNLPIDSATEEEISRFFAGGDLTSNQSNQNYINPNQKFNQRYITWLPENSTFVWIQCKMFYKVGFLKNKLQKTNSQKLFKVPNQPQEARSINLIESLLSQRTENP